MKKKQTLTLITLLLLLGGSCSNRQDQQKDGIYELDVRAALSGGHSDAVLSGLAPAIRYVPLETTEKSFLQGVNKVLLHRDHLFVSDNQRVMQFDVQGNFIRQVGRIGHGPGEYSGSIRFTVNAQHDEVVVCMTGPRRVLRYDAATGAFKGDFGLGFLVSDLLAFPGGNLAFFSREISGSFGPLEINEVIITDAHGMVADSVANPGRESNRTNSAGYASVFAHQDDLFYVYNYRDTLWRISSNPYKTPYAVFVRGNSLDSDALTFQATDQVQFPDYVWVSRLVGDQRFLFALVNKGFLPRPPEDDPNVHRMVYDKQSGRLFTTPGFANDIDGGPDFWPRWISQGMLIDSYLPHQIIEHYQQTRGSVAHGPGFASLAESLNENDNPVLMLVPAH
jgi:hypothetical protein